MMLPPDCQCNAVARHTFWAQILVCLQLQLQESSDCQVKVLQTWHLNLCLAANPIKTQQLTCNAWETVVGVAADFHVTLLCRCGESLVNQPHVTVSYMLMLD